MCFCFVLFGPSNITLFETLLRVWLCLLKLMLPQGFFAYGLEIITVDSVEWEEMYFAY